MLGACDQILYCHQSGKGAAYCMQHVFQRRTIVLNPMFVRAVKRLIDHLSPGVVEHGISAGLPSTGFISVALALAACESITIYGFTTREDARSASVCAHYYEGDWWASLGKARLVRRGEAPRCADLRHGTTETRDTTEATYFNVTAHQHAKHAWALERTALRALATAGALRIVS